MCVTAESWAPKLVSDLQKKNKGKGIEKPRSFKIFNEFRRSCASSDLFWNLLIVLLARHAVQVFPRSRWLSFPDGAVPGFCSPALETARGFCVCALGIPGSSRSASFSLCSPTVLLFVQSDGCECGGFLQHFQVPCLQSSQFLLNF